MIRDYVANQSKDKNLKQMMYRFIISKREVDYIALHGPSARSNDIKFADISKLKDEILSIYFARSYSAWKRDSKIITVYFVAAFRKVTE